MNKEKEKKQTLESIDSISFEKNAGDNYYTITTKNDDGKEIKFQALIFDANKIEKDLTRLASQRQ